MPMSLRLFFFATLLGMLTALIGAASAASAVVFDNRVAFEAQLNDIVIDGYELPAYSAGGDFGGASKTHTDAQMNAIFGETIYKTTGFLNFNRILRQNSGNHFYCAGCNGSYELDFTDTSVGTTSGVYGVGLNLIPTEPLYGTIAYVTYGNGTTENIAISEATGFWGITAPLLIAKIHFGGLNGATSKNVFAERMAMDNLTIGMSVPECSSFAAALLALGGLYISRRK